LCDYFSGILTEKGEVLWLEDNPLNHEAIIEKYKLKDTETKNRGWVRFEIKPKSIEALLKVEQRSQLTRDLFCFCWDQEGELPAWLEKNCVSMIECCWIAAEKSWLIHYLFGNEAIKELREHGYIHMMWGTSQVGVMRGTSQVGEMWGTSQVGEMWGTSQVGVMRGTSKVGVMWGTSKVGVMWGTSQVGEMWGTSQVGEMWGTSQVGVMRGTSKVGEMWGTSKVGVMRGTSKVGVMRGTSKVGEMQQWASAVKNSKLYVAKGVEVVQAGLVEA
jgi:hypothetical protein